MWHAALTRGGACVFYTQSEHFASLANAPVATEDAPVATEDDGDGPVAGEANGYGTG